jgi:hypothetical protein
MARNGDLTWIGDALKAAGLRVVYEDGWKSRGHGSFTQARAVMLHHTAGNYPGDLSLVINGRADLDGPLCNLYLAPDGVFHVVAAGKAYHAGGGQWHDLPRDQGNAYAIGIECSTGPNGDPVVGAQYGAMIAGARALLDAAKLPRSEVCAHKEYSDEGKIDIRNNMGDVRADVKASVTPADMEGIDMYVLKTKAGQGRHYVIEAGKATPLDAGYHYEGNERPVILVLAANDDGSEFTK